MIRYVAIGAVVGFLLTVLLLSQKEAPPFVPPPLPPPPVAGTVAPVRAAPEQAGVREGPRADLKVIDAPLNHAPMFLRQLAAADAGAQ